MDGIFVHIPTQGEIFQILEKNNFFKIQFKEIFYIHYSFSPSLLQITLCFTTVICHAQLANENGAYASLR